MGTQNQDQGRQQGQTTQDKDRGQQQQGGGSRAGGGQAGQDQGDGNRQQGGSSQASDRQQEQQIDRQRDRVKDTALSEDNVDDQNDVGSTGGTSKPDRR
jgi:hypothetical protein